MLGNKIKVSFRNQSFCYTAEQQMFYLKRDYRQHAMPTRFLRTVHINIVSLSLTNIKDFITRVGISKNSPIILDMEICLIIRINREIKKMDGLKK